MNMPESSVLPNIVMCPVKMFGLHKWTVLLLSSVLLQISCGSIRLHAAERSIGPIRRTYVPAERPDVWPAGRWEALPINEFRQLLKDLSPVESTPPPTVLKRVSYSATWTEDSFIEGELTAQVGLSGFEPKYHSLGQPTLSLTNFFWQDRPAEWGTDPEGQALIRIESDGSQLRGQWSLQGQEVLGDVEFEAVLPPSIISRFELRLPSEKYLSVKDGIYAVTLDDPVPGWKRWVLDLGNKSQFRFTITNELQQFSAPQLVTQRKSQYRLLPEELRFNINFVIDNLGGAVEELIFDVPSEMPISSIMLGNDIEIPFHRISEGDRIGVVVPLKSITLNSRTSITVHGGMPLGSEKTWRLPRISLSQAHLIESQMSIKVHRPLELSDYSSKDCRLISSTLNRNQTDSLEFEDWAESSEVSVTLDTPQADVVSDVLTTITGDLSQSVMKTLLRLTTRSGSVYKLPCFVPPGWKVTAISSIPWKRPDIVSQWRMSATEDGGSQLTVEFRDALTSEQSVIIEVIARRAFDPAASTMIIPIIRPLDAMPRSVAMVLKPVAGQEFSLADDSLYVEQTLSEATTHWTNELESTNWLDIAGDPAVLEARPFVVFTDAPSDSDQLIIAATKEMKLPMLAESSISTPRTSTDQLSSADSFGSESNSSTASGRITAEVTLETTVPDSAEHPCVHRIKYTLPASAAGKDLEFTISDPAMFIALNESGTRDPILVSDHLVQIHLPDTGDNFDIKLEYRSPFSQTMLSGKAIIPLPKSNVVKTDIRWRLLLPPSFRLTPSTTGTSCEQPSVSWTQRVTGPLGRGHSQSSKLPISSHVQQDAGPSEFELLDSEMTIARQNRVLMRDTSEHTRSVPFSADVLQLQIWKEDMSCRVGWLLMIAGCMATGLIRRINPPRSTFIIFVCGIASGLMSALVSDAFAILAGGLFFGVLCGMLLPQRLWNHRLPTEKRPVGSTRRAPVFAGAGMLLLSFAVWFATSANAMQISQSGGKSTSRAIDPPQSAPQYDALIPVRSQRPSLNETPVAYVSPALLEEWQSYRHATATSPDYLLRDAEYEITLDQRPFPRMSAVFDVVLLNPLTRQIRIPLDGIAIEREDACTVNGQVATIIPLTTSRGISIDLDSMIPTSLPAIENESNLVDSQSEMMDDRAKVLRIVIDCHLRSYKAGNLYQMNVAIPPVLSTTALLKNDGLDIENHSVHRYGSEKRNIANQTSRIELGPVQRLQIDWSHHGNEPVSEAFIPDLAMTNIIVHPQQLKATTRLKYVINQSSETSTNSTVLFNLPSYAQIQDVRAPGLQEWNVRHHDTEPVAVRLTFSEPLLSQSIVVDLEYVLPGTLTAGKLTIPALFPSTGRQKVDFPVHSLGLTAATGFRIEHLSALHQSAQVMRISPDQFRQDWGVEDNIKLDLAYSLKAPQPLGFKVVPILPDRRALITESMTIDSSSCEWQADIELTSQGAPIALHRFTLNPHITITSASVTQEGTETLSRWTKTSEEQQLLLLLSNEVSGNQRIHLTGKLDIDAGEPTRLADFAIENAVVSQHILTIQWHSNLTLEVFDSLERPILLEEDETGLTAESGVLHQHTYDLLSDVAPERVRIDSATKEFPYERFITVDTRQEKQWSLTTQLIFPMDTKLPHQIQVIVPSEFAGVEFAPKSSPPAQKTTFDDGRPVLTFSTTTLDFDSRRLRITLTTPSQAEFPWEVPQLKVLNGLQKKEWLVLTPNSMYEVKGEENSVVAEDLPERFSLPDGVEQNDIAVFYSMHGKWTLTPRNLAAANGFVRQLDTIIWDANSEELCGVTIAEVSIRNLNQFAIRLPPGLRVTYIDSGDVVTSPVKDNLVGELVVPVAPRAVDRDMSFLLKVWWTLPKTSIAMRYDIPLLQPKELPIISQQIVFLGSDESRYEVTGSPLFLRVDPVNLLNSQAPKKSSPIIRLLEDAGYFPSSDQATSILIGTVEYDSSQRADALISIWRLSKQLRRFLLILLVSILGLIIGWKTRGYFLLRDQLSRINHSLYAGPTLLALLIWTSGPILMGITLTLLSVTAWGLALWKAHGHATEFEYTPVTTS